MPQLLCTRAAAAAHSSSGRYGPSISFTKFAFCTNSPHPKRPSNLKGRSPDAQRWLVRQFKDPYVIKSKLANYRSRSAFKLIQIDDRHHILKPGFRVVDCGAAPGGWTQVAVERVNALGDKPKEPIGRVLAVDKIFMVPIDGAFVMTERDFTQAETRKAIDDHFASGDCSNPKDNLVDVVLSDMAPSRTGSPPCDHDRIIALCYEALVFAVRHLAKGGSFLTKLWDGASKSKLESDMKKHFDKVINVKPDASRDDSAETFLLGKAFKGLKRSE